MNLKRVFMPESVAKQLRSFPADTRLHVEMYLENLDLIMVNTPRPLLVKRLERGEEGFVATVNEASLHFSVDVDSCTAFIWRIELPFPVRPLNG